MSTDASSVAAYDMPAQWPSEQQEGGGTPRSAPLSRGVVGGGASLRLRASADAGPARPEEAALRAPAVVIPGAPALTALRVLPDRRHVLTRDSGGRVALWDVLRGAPVEALPEGTDLAAAERALWRPTAGQPWFAADVRLGRLALHLDPPGCFAAEAYARERAFFAFLLS